MTISIYTCVKNGIFYDYHVVEMLKHHLPFADEIIVNEGQSSDDTFERISSIDSKIKVYRSDWKEPGNSLDWIVRVKNEARVRCTSDWCILLDCDEFIPDWDFDRIKARLDEESGPMLSMEMINFYGNYKVYHSRPNEVTWPVWKMNIHRNLPGIEVWGDGSHVRLSGMPFERLTMQSICSLHHFGCVRKPARLRQKWRILAPLYSGKTLMKLPSFLFNWRPHDWMDGQFLSGLEIYEGPYVQAVRENPEEFIRDGFQLYEWLRNQGAR